jgi:hypothetical protein
MRRQVLFGIAIAASVVGSIALAEKMDPRRPKDFVVGLPKGSWPTTRMDVRRAAMSDVPLPRSLKKDWSRQTSSAIETSPLVNDKGEIVSVNARGELIWLDEKGGELSHVPLGTGPSGPPTLLADGTVVVVSTSGEAVLANKSGVRNRVRLGGDRGGGPAPLPLEDGGVVVATASELDALDSSGAVRARATLPEAMSGGALLATAGKVIAVAASGVVYGWSPGRDVARLGSFGGQVDGGATVYDDHTLVAVVDVTRIVTLDIDRGVPVPRTAPIVGFYLGPVAVRGKTIYAMLETSVQTFVVAIDGNGQEVLRAGVSAPQTTSASDGGVITVLPHAGVIVDSKGTVAYATPDGQTGIVDPAGVVNPAPDVPCMRVLGARGRSSAVQGLLPAAPGVIVVACESGTIARYTSGG